MAVVDEISFEGYSRECGKTLGLILGNNNLGHIGQERRCVVKFDDLLSIRQENTIGRIQILQLCGIN